MNLKLLLVSALISQISGSACPSKCTCSLDVKGRKTVACLKGGMTGSVNLDGVNLDTEVIKISAPEDNMNDLQMSPIFQSYKNLEEIHVTRSNIPQLGMHFFWGLNKLEVLNLSQNNITQALSYNFRGTPKLKELYLDDNRIHSLPSTTFNYLEELRLFSIQRNRLTVLVTSLFYKLDKLKILKLSGNDLKELNPEVFKDVQGLRVLECRGCSISRLDPLVYNELPHLSHLDLGDNEIKSISKEDIKGLSHLRNLKLDGNKIKLIEDYSFVHQGGLRKLNLAGNEIAKIAISAFQDLHNLTELDLSYNKLHSLHNGSLQPISGTLEVLMLNGNHLKLSSLQELASVELKELHLANCGITDIYMNVLPDTLSVLNLARNLLSSLPSEILPLNLNSLDISRNSFRGLDDDVLNRLENIKTIKLENNPWSCDLCHIVPIMERMNRTRAYRDIICMFPYTVKNKKLETIKRNELTWCTATSYSSSDANFFLLGDDGKIGIIVAGASVCLLCLTVFVIVGALCYSRRHAAKYYTHEDKLAMEGESIFDNNHSPLFCDRELSFKFPLDGEKKISISTIDEIKKEHGISNGT